MLAGRRSSRASGRWSRLGDRCTQALCPRPPGAALRPFPRPAGVICGAWCVCVGVRVTVASAGGGAGGAVLRRPRRACLQSILMSVGPPPALPARRPTQHTARPPHCVRLASIPTLVCGGGGGAAALVDGGMVKGRQCVCVRVYLQTHPF